MPETSELTRVLLVDVDQPAPTVMAYGMGNCKYSQCYIRERERERERVSCLRFLNTC